MKLRSAWRTGTAPSGKRPLLERSLTEDLEPTLAPKAMCDLPVFISDFCSCGAPLALVGALRCVASCLAGHTCNEPLTRL